MSQQAIRLNLNEDNAIKLIKGIYHRKTIKEMEQIRNDCQAYLLDEGTVQYYGFRQRWLQIGTEEMRLTLTRAAIDAMLPDWQRFIYLRYGQGILMQFIANDLYSSVAQLNNWNHKILAKISAYACDLVLASDDIFHRTKVLNIVDVLTRMTDFCEKIDPCNDIVAKDWLSTLEYRRNQYRIILSMIDDCLRNRESGIKCKIIASKLSYPNETSCNIAANLGIDKPQTSRALREFIRSCEPYLC